MVKNRDCFACPVRRRVAKTRGGTLIGFLARAGELVLNAALMAEAKKYEVKVTVTTHYVAEQSDPAINRHVFAYTVEIQNTGTVSAQLISRHWLITDAEGQVQEVRERSYRKGQR